jgi:hypothetical protein
MEKKSDKIVWIVAGIAIIILCCCLLIAGGAFYGLYKFGREIETQVKETGLIPSPEPPVEIQRTPVVDVPLDTYALLKITDVPQNNIPDLACRLQDKCGIPETVAFPGEFKTGDARKFWVTDTDTNKNFEITATLRYATDHVYFWIQDGVNYNSNDVKNICEEFENKIYPTDREFFGSEWTPGIDNDPHIYILYTRGMGSRVAGYFSSSDEYNPLAREYSNAHEMFLFNADNTSINGSEGVLAHEFQHMIHWKIDRNESSWLNEGFAELAAFLNGYDTGGWDWSYAWQPDLQLNDWPNDPNGTGPHYGSGFLFTAYLLDRFGRETTQAIVRDPLNGLESIDETLREENVTDPVTGQPIGADDVVLDWMIANYVKDANVGDGRYTYHNYPDSPQVSVSEEISTCPYESTFGVHQYGADYIHITCPGKATLTFTGSTSSELLPVDPYSGTHAFWSNMGDESDMTLTRSFDFSNVGGPIEMSYRIWYDLEKDYDYAYLEVSEDGQHWQILTTPLGTGEDPSGNSYGWGYNGNSGGWREEKIDLSAYAGKQVQVRFEYITDAAVNGDGLMVDDVSIPAIDYATDFENGDDGWQAAGFVRIENQLPQTFRLALILKGSNGTTVQVIKVNDDQTAVIPLDLGGEYDDAVLVITGTTRFTRTRAGYRIDIR